MVVKVFLCTQVLRKMEAVVLMIVTLSLGGGELVAASTVLEVGSCPNVTSVRNLDLGKIHLTVSNEYERSVHLICVVPAPSHHILAQLEGRWYQILQIPTEDNSIAKCTRSTYTYTDGYLKVVTEGRSAGGGEVARTGVLAKLPHSPSGALQLDMDGMPPLDIWVVYTDYSSVACLYSCAEFHGLKAEWAWAVASSPRPQVKMVNRCRAKLRLHQVNTAKLQRVPHSARCLKGD
ncbi:Crustacyanin-A2 subunit [Portunus trituberculatus]|uniref:Crustacyanin-A2 subunit n=1 Tax=Portunus trituberculatus TaxID=210409 RepID=A0A5B7H545_PORTR|nr:Crustacyanin-A2 subunit [Portunus trituberculatus]